MNSHKIYLKYEIRSKVLKSGKVLKLVSTTQINSIINIVPSWLLSLFIKYLRLCVYKSIEMFVYDNCDLKK